MASAGVLFRNVYTHVPLTLPSHASIMTGLAPPATGVHNNGSYVLAPERRTMAMNLASTGDLAGAIALYKALVADFPGDHVLRQHLGVAFGVAGDFAKAIESFEQAIAIKPTPSA
jgi:tetratricopeptide (TPR) repeat protein